MDQNLKAILDMIAMSEGTYGKGDDGYNVLAGGRAFLSLRDHPNVLVSLPRKSGDPLETTAAGRYQLLHRYWAAYQKLLNLPDFGHASQDAVALQQIKECGAYQAALDGDIPAFCARASRIWASIPGNDYGQPVHTVEQLTAWFKERGGVCKSHS